MLALLSLGFALALLGVNVWGMTLAAGFVWCRRWLALIAAPWVAVTGFFGLECLVGLGELQALGVGTTLVSIALIHLSGSTWQPGWLRGRGQVLLASWRAEFAPRRLAGCGAVFGAGFLYAWVWRYAYPDLHAWIEKIPDFAYVAAYSSGQRLPVADVWLSPYVSTHYYAFQHYAAALAGRLLGISPGFACNLGFCLMIGWIGAGFGAVVVELSRSWRVRCAVWLALMVGGSGVTLFAPLLLKQSLPWEQTFLFGTVTMDQAPVGTALEEYSRGFKRMNLPIEPLAYSIYLGDYHAPLSSYALMGLAAAAALHWQQSRRRRDAALVGATLTWTVLANLWTLPLQGVAVVAWAVWHRREARHLVPALLAGAAGVWTLTWGYLSLFATESVRQGVRMEWVPSDEHTPPWFFLIALAPTLLLAAAALASTDRRAVRLAGCALAFLAISELVFVNDSYSGLDNRFNTTLKWWPWITAAATLLVGPVVLSAVGRRTVRALAWLAVLAPCLYAGSLVNYWMTGDRSSAGHLDGHRFMTKEIGARLLLQRLEREPRGVAVEDPRDDGNEGPASLPLHAGHRLWLGWDGYQGLWRGFPEDVSQRRSALVRFYDGDMPDAANWLPSEEIDYVLFYRVTDTRERWEKINRQIDGGHVWCEVVTLGDRPVGFWKRRPVAVRSR